MSHYDERDPIHSIKIFYVSITVGSSGEDTRYGDSKDI